MKKLLILFIMFGMFLIPQITLDAAMTAPAEYDYSFLYNSTDGEFQFSDGVDTYTPEFTRNADGIYFNYTYTGDGEGLLPFEISLTYNRSNTSWTFGTTGYIATDTIIGSDSSVGNVSKLIFEINNNSNNDYFLYYDNSTSGNANGINWYYSINDLFQTYSYLADSIYYFGNLTTGNTFYVYAHSNLKFRLPTSSQLYNEGFYLKDLGTSLAVQSTTAYNSGYDDGFGDGYLTGVAEDNAYSIGYAKGLIDGGDMETGSSIIVLVLAALSFGFMIFGFSSRKRIFNLFAAGLFIALGGLMVEYAAFIIISIGFVIFNIWYTFASD